MASDNSDLDRRNKLDKLAEYRKQEISLTRLPTTIAKQMRFLRAYANGPTAGVLKRSAEVANITLASHYNWLDSDPIYVELFKKARRISVAVLEDAVIQRGVEGVDFPVGFHKGEPGAWVKQYSDTLLLSALGARAPELGYNYRMNKLEVTGANGGPIELNVTAQPIPLHKLSLQAQQEILAILERELGSEEVKALNPAPEEPIDVTAAMEEIFAADLEDNSGERVNRDIWDLNDLMLLV